MMYEYIAHKTLYGLKWLPWQPATDQLKNFAT